MSDDLRRRRPKLTRNVAPGVHRLSHAAVNCYLIEDRGEVTIVDAAFPGTWRAVVPALRAIGREPNDVKALVLTHAHFDHLGFAQRLHNEWNVPVWLHPLDAFIAAHPYRYAHERSRLVYPLTHLAALPVLIAMAAAGALRVPPVVHSHSFSDGEQLEVPGHPTVVFSPGHTLGHCALSLPDRHTLITGDALVTFDPYTARRGPQIVSGAATRDSAQALASLDRLDTTQARIVLPGHGPAWRADIHLATQHARSVGAS